jgi:arsenate reductase
MMCELFSVLFVCTGNAGRSQMAQAMFRFLAGGKARAESAGVEPWDRLHPMAVQMMSERGLDLKGHYPKPVSSVAEELFEVVVTIGDPAKEKLPPRLVETARWIHWDIADPADADGTVESEAVFARTASDIADRLPQLLDLVIGTGEVQCHKQDSQQPT